MKQRLYALAFFAFSIALSSCQKDDEPAPVPEVVGKWTVDYGITSEFSSASDNGVKINPFSELWWGDSFLTSQIHILNNSNKTFVEVVKVGPVAEDFPGTWNYENNTLKLTYDQASLGEETFTFRTTNGLNELISAPIDFRFDSTSAGAGKIQWLYRK